MSTNDNIKQNDYQLHCKSKMSTYDNEAAMNLPPN